MADERDQFDQDFARAAEPSLDGYFGKASGDMAILYSRGAATIPVSASRITRSFTVTDDQGVQTETAGGEWYVVGLDFGGGPVAPQHGDEISTNGETFVVVPMAGLPATEWLPERSRYLVRTKKVG